MKSVIEPYKHNCTNCVWGGWITIGNKLGNIYFCPNSDGKHSKVLGHVIIRFSDKPLDYWDAPIGAFKKTPLELEEENNEIS